MESSEGRRGSPSPGEGVILYQQWVFVVFIHKSLEYIKQKETIKVDVSGYNNIL